MSKPKVVYKSDVGQIVNVLVKHTVGDVDTEALDLFWEFFQRTGIIGEFNLVIVNSRPEPDVARRVRLLEFTTEAHGVELKIQLRRDCCYLGTLILVSIETGLTVSKIRGKLWELAGDGWYDYTDPATRVVRPPKGPLPGLGSLGLSLDGALAGAASGLTGASGSEAPAEKRASHGASKDPEFVRAVFLKLAQRAEVNGEVASDIASEVIMAELGEKAVNGRSGGRILATLIRQGHLVKGTQLTSTRWLLTFGKDIVTKLDLKFGQQPGGAPPAAGTDQTGASAPPPESPEPEAESGRTQYARTHKQAERIVEGADAAAAELESAETQLAALQQHVQELRAAVNDPKVSTARQLVAAMREFAKLVGS